MSQLVQMVLKIDKCLNYKMCGVNFAPLNRLVQGDPWSALLFVFYINDSMNLVSQSHEKAHIQVFIDDIIIQLDNLQILDMAIKCIVFGMAID